MTGDSTHQRPETTEVPKYRLIPEQFGDYDRLDHGHPGGMGVVYRVLNRKLNVERALKVLRPDVADRMPVREAFIREANFGAQLAAGPYILPVHAVGTLREWDFFEMDWVEGPNLFEFLKERKRLHPWAALTLCAMVLDALNYAHRATIRYPDGSTKVGIIHRDIKPANILIDTRTTRPLLTDFGIALAREAARDRQGGYTAGTINYLSPELIQDRPIDERSDIYQVGLVLYELLSGQKTFPGGAGEGVSGNIVAGYKKRAVRLDDVQLGRHEKKLDSTVVGIVERALELEPNSRWQSAGQMRDEIRAYLRRKYTDHDPQQAFAKYYKDSSVPTERFSERVKKLVKAAKEQAPRVLWTLLILAVVVGSIWGGKYGYTKYWQAKFTEEFNNYRVEREAWDQQPWDAARVDAVRQKDQEILRNSAAHDYRAARNLSKSLADQLRSDIDSVKGPYEIARRRYREEIDVFRLQKWPDDLRRGVERADSSLLNLSAVYVQARKAYEDQTRLLCFHDSAKADTFRVRADQTEATRRSYEDQHTGDRCGDSARAFASVIARIRQEYGDQKRYQDGIDALGEIQIPLPTWSPCQGPQPPGPCQAERDSLQQARAKLQRFTNRSDWREHQQSQAYPQCNIPAVREWLDDAWRLIQADDCEGARMRTSSAAQCIATLERESAVAQPGGGGAGEEAAPDTTEPPPISADSAYALGQAAYDEGRWMEARKYLALVPHPHPMFRESQLMMAHSRCADGDRDPKLLNEVTLALYDSAGPLVDRDKGLTCTNKLRCFYRLRMCDSVDSYFEKAIGTGELKCDNEDARYANSLNCKIRCDFSRYQSARTRGNDDEKVLWGSSVIQNCTKFFECFNGPRWRVMGDEIHDVCNEVRNE